jgi:hypothetical protein
VVRLDENTAGPNPAAAPDAAANLRKSRLDEFFLDMVVRRWMLTFFRYDR